ncbi:MAG: isoprenylcysteine carboxylmethyltransferase family protein [Synergistaceae bacterium]|nr:isoprenylcysteine carboxylmethyltransferase family protein [Synergistaceae bacterium]
MQKFREFIFRMRGGLWTLLFAVILFAAYGSKTSSLQIFSGIIIILAGQIWRCWAAGFIGLYRGENVKALRLAQTGPYALMRNPLYFGNFLIGLGWSIIAGIYAVIIFVVSFYLIYVVVIIPHEENFLRAKFGTEYNNYCKRVKRFWPAVLKISDLTGKFDTKILLRSEIHTIITTLAGTIIIIAITS